MGQELHTVADAEDGQAAFEDVRGRHGRPFLVDAGRPAREDKPPGVQALHLFPGSVRWEELAVDVALAHPTGDEHAVLGAEIEDDDGLGRRDGLPFGSTRRALLGDLQVGGDL